MHSRIFEIVKVEDGADYNSYMEESDFYKLVPSKFDYVNAETNLVDDIAWLKNSMEYMFTNEDTLELTLENRKTYFEERFEFFKEIANKMTLEEFATGHSDNYLYSVYSLHENIRDDYGFYVYNSGRVEPFDDFVRYYFDGQYKIVGSMDYRW